MGFDELVLVDPADRKILNRQKAIDGASGARGILERAKVYDNLPDALEGIDVRCATGMPTDMARARATQVFREPRNYFQEIGDIGSVAFVFGNERLGLAEEDMALCDVVLGIPTNPDFGSLNLASAVQLVAYDWRQALGGFPSRQRGGGRPSTRLYASARDDDGAPATKTRFVLVQTRHPGNVGAAARALLTMGFDELVLVDPADRGVLNRKKAIDGASGARGILEKAKIEDSLAAALEGF